MGLDIPLLLASDPDTLEVCLSHSILFWAAAWKFVVEKNLVLHEKDYADKKVAVLLNFAGMEAVLLK